MKKFKSRKWGIRKQGVLKGLGTLVLVFVIFYCSSYVDAGDYDSVIEKNRMDGVYAIATIDGITRIFYLNMYEMNERISYCIDLGMDITTSIYHSTNDFSVSYLNKEQIEYIRSISYFGYGYEGHEDYKYYMAAQELIWEYLGDLDVVWTTEMKVDGIRINIDSYKEEILNLIDLYNRKLGLEWIDGQVYKVGSELVIKDNNGVLSDYEVLSSEYSDAFIDNDNLVIKVGNVIGEEKIVLRRKGYYEYESSFYYYDNSQRLISNGNYRDVDEILNFNIEGVTLNVQMINSNTGSKYPFGEASFEGAIYELYNKDDELVGTYKTNEKGFFKVDGLLLGNYYVKQISASEGYLVNSDKVNFKVNKEVNEVLLRQNVIYNTIEIRKVYGSNGNYKPEGGILFWIFNHLGYAQTDAWTNSEGRIVVRLSYGSYRVQQVNTTPGYAKVDDFVIEVKEPKEDVIYYNLVNELILVKVKVCTLDSVSGESIRLEGFSYRIRKKNENTYLEVDGNDIFRTDSNGELLIPVLFDYGDYILEQVDVPKGVLLNDKIQEFSINERSNLSLIENSLVMNINVYNEFVMGRVKVLATEERFYKEVNNYEYENFFRGGSEFSLVADSNVVINGKVRYKTGDEVYNGVTDDDGELVIDNLHLGSYCLVDKVTEGRKCFVLESIDNKTKVVEEFLEFEKFLSKGDIIIQNVSSDGEYIIDSVFEVIDTDGMVIYTGITNDEGVIKVEDILIGDYCIKQRDVSSNYLKLDNEVCFSLGEEDKRLDIINEKLVKEIISVPNTFKESIGFYEAMIFFAMIGTGYIVYKKIFASRLYR